MIDFYNEEEVIKEMAEELGAVEDDMLVSLEDGFSSDYYKIEIGDREYWVFKDEESAIAEAESRIREDLENEPELFDENFLKDYIYMPDAEAVASDFGEIYREDLESNEYELRNEWEETIENEKYNFIDIKRKELQNEYENEDDLEDALEEAWEEYKDERWEEEKDDFIEEKVNEYIKEVEEKLKDDPIDYLVNEQGLYTNLKELLDAGLIHIDVDEASKRAVELDGWGHFLAVYDGKERYTKNGLAYGRVG